MFHTVVSAYFSEACVMIFCDALKIMGSVKIIYIPYSLKDLFVFEIASVFICICVGFFSKNLSKWLLFSSYPHPSAPGYLGVFVTDRYLNF